MTPDETIRAALVRRAVVLVGRTAALRFHADFKAEQLNRDELAKSLRRSRPTPETIVTPGNLIGELLEEA